MRTCGDEAGEESSEKASPCTCCLQVLPSIQITRVPRPSGTLFYSGVMGPELPRPYVGVLCAALLILFLRLPHKDQTSRPGCLPNYRPSVGSHGPCAHVLSVLLKLIHVRLLTAF